MVNAKIITLINGKKRLLYQSHTYFVRYETKNETRWSCSHFPKCKASLYANNNQIVTKIIGEHCHGTKKLYVSATGHYVVY
ncbi:hypothetical protein HW555_009353 [Spodoptera exigua]|uniref:FLYWCH-type domain-containing protein n=1 Tax=Spodoptera exigua TaxID=7107 RepID=A0A835G926_SPOEX|nr:hypothetical protein HW555_009353 [Spodoptera exigua]